MDERSIEDLIENFYDFFNENIIVTRQFRNDKTFNGVMKFETYYILELKNMPQEVLQVAEEKDKILVVQTNNPHESSHWKKPQNISNAQYAIEAHFIPLDKMKVNFFFVNNYFLKTISF